MSEKNERQAKRTSEEARMPMDCSEIQGVLFDYMARELGPARSNLVREHLRHCENCRRTAAEMQSTMDALRAASRLPSGVAEHLSGDRQRQLARVIMHPLLDWITTHHVLVSILAAIVAFLLGFLIISRIHVRLDDDVKEGTEVIIGTPPGASATSNAPPR
jgi:anti-sigma factor RsiW